MKQALRIEANDNVAIASESLVKGENISVNGITQPIVSQNDIPIGHKMALTDIAAGEYIIKYGIPIAQATADIRPGDWVHTHNVKDVTESLCNRYVEEFKKNPPESGYKTLSVECSDRTFMAYPRSNGTVGIRNYVLVVATVHCSGAVAKRIATITGTAPLIHDFGCGEGELQSKQTRTCLTEICRHPNIYGVLFVGLGCEQIKAKEMAEELRAFGRRAEYLIIQDEGGPEETVKKGVDLVAKLKKEAAEEKRVPCPISKLTVGVQCGSSDWTTAISGNTTLGAAVDSLTKCGATVLMSEIGGLPGSDHILAMNAVSKEVALDIIGACEKTRAAQIRRTGKTIEETNPTPGNKDGGITTLVEKSTGNIKKAGSSPIQGVLHLYDKPASPGGIWLVDPQCSGLESVTIMGMALSGAQLLLFTTGRGTPVGNIMIPVYRLTGNPKSFEQFPSMIDFNAGKVLLGTDMAVVAKELYEETVKVAEGQLTCTERNADFEYMMLHPEVE